MPQLAGKYLIIAGLVLIALGGGFLLAGRIPYIGKLPGDILIEKENFTSYFPVTTCILVSIVLSFLFYFFSRR